MDSLMDTLTNVVGILMIILILIQLNVSQAITRIISDLPPVDAAQLEKIRDQASSAAARVAQREQELSQAAENRVELTTVQRELATLRNRLEQQEAVLMKKETLVEKVRQARESLDDMRKKSQQLLTERNRLSQLLAEPAPKPPPPATVSLPSAKPVPKGAEVKRFFLSHGKVYPHETGAIEQAIMAEIRRNLPDLRISERRTRDGRVVPVIDQNKLHQHFRKLDMRVGAYQVQIIKRPTHDKVAFRAVPIESLGMRVDPRLLADFPRLLRTLRDADNVVLFRVTPDSFALYDTARDTANRMGLAVGWEPVPVAALQKRLDQFFVKPLRDPPPAKPKPADPDAITIPPPRPTID